MPASAIVFVMDGLMVDTEPLARAAWDEVLAPYGRAVSDDLYRRMLGRRTVESAGYVLDAFSLPLTADDLIARKTAVFLDSLNGGAPPMPGLFDLLGAIEARGLPWAVATSTPRPTAEIILGSLGVLDRLSALATGDEVAHGKPAPDIFLLAAGRLGVDPARCLALEDTPTGCTAAAAAGMRVIAVPGEWTDRAAFGCAFRVAGSLVDVARDLPDLLSGAAGDTG
jgi:HAD superfamily hydrolase (TIGR01509 family)